MSNSQKGQAGKIKNNFEEDPKLMAQLQLTLADLDAELAGKVLDRTGITHMFNSILSISSKEKLLFGYFYVFLNFDLLHFYFA